MPFPRPTLTTLRTQAMQDVTASDLPNADGFLRRAALRVLAWVQAGLAYLHYAYLDWISLQSTPFTATGEFLDGWAALAPTPVLRSAPAAASGPAAWQGVAGTPLNAGVVCTRSDNFQYEIASTVTVDSAGTVTATVIALTAGSTGNSDSGTPLQLTTVIAGINSAGAATGPITGGTDEEQDAPLKSAMLESYANPPHGGSVADYVTWALQVAGVTRAWCVNSLGGAGSVTVFFMMDEAEAAHNGFPQGTNGVATLETRVTPTATGDQLAVANYIYPLRTATTIVYANAPTPQAVNFVIDAWSSFSSAQQTAVEAALATLFVQKDGADGSTSIEQSDCDGAIAAIGGLPDFAITSPSSWPLTSPVGSLLTLGTVS